MPEMAYTDDDAVKRLAWRPDDLNQSMLSFVRMSTPPLINVASRTSAFGSLDRLPQEILHIILNLLDLQTLSRMTQTCFSGLSGLSVIQSMRAYRGLLEHASSTIAALGQTKLLGIHIPAQLWGALRSDRCECCPYYGAFLFLPTCMRCCWECLRLKPSLRVLSLQQARPYFGLKKSHVQRLPALHPIPGNYMFSHTVKVPPQLVSAAAAKELGISVHGSCESFEDSLVRRLKSNSSRIIGRFYQRASMTPLKEDLLARPGQGNIPTSECFGMASTPFPYLQPSGSIKNGLWCTGCQLIAELYRARKLDPTTLARIVQRNWEPERVLHGKSR